MMNPSKKEPETFFRAEVLFTTSNRDFAWHVEPVFYEKFFVIKSLDGVSITDLDIFDVHRTLINVCGREPRISPQRSSNFLVEVTSTEESALLRAISTIPGPKVTCPPHSTLNQCKGIVFFRDVIYYSKERFVVSSQDVLKVERLHRRVNRVLVATPTLIGSFSPRMSKWSGS